MQMPEHKQIKDLFEGLLGRDITIAAALEALGPAADPRPTVGAYVDDAGRLTTVVLMEFPLAAHTGAALGLVPAGGAAAAIEDGVLPGTLLENTVEMLNVLAAPIGEASGVHQRLAGTHAPHEALPPEVGSLGATLGARLDVVIDIAGYGGGRLAVVSAP